MKKHITFIAACALALTLCSCGASDASSDAEKKITKASASAAVAEAGDDEREEPAGTTTKETEPEVVEESIPEEEGDTQSAADESAPEEKQTTPAETKAPETKPTEKKTTPAETKPAATKPAAPQAPAAAKEFYDPSGPAPLLNNIKVQPVRIYEQNGYLILEAYVINGYDHPVWNINNMQISLADGKGVTFASANFGTMFNNDGSTVAINTYSYIQWTFRFDKSCYDLSSADLSQVNTYTSCRNSF